MATDKKHQWCHGLKEFKSTRSSSFPASDPRGAAMADMGIQRTGMRRVRVVRQGPAGARSHGCCPGTADGARPLRKAGRSASNSQPGTHPRCSKATSPSLSRHGRFRRGARTLRDLDWPRDLEAARASVVPSVQWREGSHGGQDSRVHAPWPPAASRPPATPALRRRPTPQPPRWSPRAGTRLTASGRMRSACPAARAASRP